MPLPDTVRKVQRPLIREEVYATLHELIVNGTLQPGEQMRDHDLAAALGVSRTPVREALRQLEDEGLVETSLNRWTRVAPLRIEDAHNLFPIMGALDPLALLLAQVRLATAEIEAMREANAAIGRALAAGKPLEALDADYAFHHVFRSRCGNPELAKIVEDVRVKFRRIAVAYFDEIGIAHGSVTEHAAVVSALDAGDCRAAAQALEAHWRGVYRRFLGHTGVEAPPALATLPWP